MISLATVPQALSNKKFVNEELLKAVSLRGSEVFNVCSRSAHY